VTRLLVLLVAGLFIVFFAFLTLSVISREGLTLAGLISIFVLALFCFGIIGALFNPPK
jgi:hypothetical protein